MTHLSAKDVNIKRSGRNILKNISLSLGSGELVGLIGPNGAGKTTLLKVLLGLMEPTSGLVQLNNIPISKVSRKTVASHIGYLAQGSPCHWPLTVEKVVELGYLSRGKARNNDTASKLFSLDQAINKLGLSSLRHRLVPTLSGGERTLTMIARCLMGGSPLLLADEPITGLDPGHQVDVMLNFLDHISDINGVVAVLHDLNIAAQYCDRLILMDQGAIVSDGHPKDVLTSKNLIDVYGIVADISLKDGRPLVIGHRGRGGHGF